MSADFMTLIVIVILFAIALVTGAYSYRRNKDTPQQWRSDFWQGISTEMIGAVITGILFGVIIAGIEYSNDQKEIEFRLLRELRSQDTTVTSLAIGEAYDRGWLGENQSIIQGRGFANSNWSGFNLENVALQYVELPKANLKGVSFYDSNLQHASLPYANLQDAYLPRANLQGVNLWHANLQDADLRNTDLRDANLWHADLQNADLRGANLDGVQFYNTNLEGVNLTDANLQSAEFIFLFDEFGEEKDHSSFSLDTVLPDGTNWVEGTDLTLTRFTDPNHPDFWQPDWVKESQG